MKTPSNLFLISTTLLFAACQHLPPRPATAAHVAKLTTPAAGTYPITIVPGKYGGGFILDNVGGQVFDTSKAFYLEAGVHQFDVAAVGRSNFLFEVRPDGTVANVSNPKAAHAKGSTLVLHTTPVTVDPGPLGAGGNVCEMGAYPASRFGFVTKRTTFALVPAMVYQFDSGVRLGGSAFKFDVREDGTVWSDSHAARGGPHLLKLHVGWVDVEPMANQAASFRIGASREYVGKHRVPVIFGLLTTLRVGTAEATFVPDYASTEPWYPTLGGEKFKISIPWDQPR